MKVSWKLALLLAALVVGLLQANLNAGEKKKEGDKKPEPGKDVLVKGEITQADVKDKKRTQSYCKTYMFKMTEGHTYQIDMRTTNKDDRFDPYLRLENSAGEEVASDDDGGGFPDARIEYRAAKSGDYTIICTTFGANSVGKFVLTVKDLDAKQPPPKNGLDKKDIDPPVKGGAKAIELKPAKDGTADFNGELTDQDGMYTNRKISKFFSYPMEAGKTYRIDLSSKAFDAYLYLEDSTGKVVDQKDDNGESFVARIIHKAEKTGAYRIVATSLGGKGVGAFGLTVRPASDTEVKQLSLRKQIDKLFDATADERKQTVKDIASYLESKGRKINQSDVRLAFDVAQLLEFAKDEKTAGEACVLYAKLVLQSEDAKAAEAARTLNGVGKRMTLLGNEMQVKGKTLDGKDFDLKNLKGKVVLVDFWATWCGPCVGEIPHLKKMYAKYNKDGFEIIGISLDDSPDTLKKFIAKEELPWNSIFDGVGREGAGLSDSYGVMSIPLCILVGRDGRVVSMRARGPELTRLLEEIFEAKK